MVADGSTLSREPSGTRLFGQPVRIWRENCGTARVLLADETLAPVKERYGFIWTSPGEPEGEVLDIPEASDDERHVLCGGSFGVHVSGLRAVENFRYGPLPFVHSIIWVSNHTLKSGPIQWTSKTRCWSQATVSFPARRIAYRQRRHDRRLRLQSVQPLCCSAIQNESRLRKPARFHCPVHSTDQ